MTSSSGAEVGGTGLHLGLGRGGVSDPTPAQSLDMPGSHSCSRPAPPGPVVPWPHKTGVESGKRRGMGWCGVGGGRGSGEQKETTDAAVKELGGLVRRQRGRVMASMP